MKRSGVAVLVIILVSATTSIAIAQESVYNAYIEAARKAQSESEKAKLYGMAVKEAEGLKNTKLLGQALIASAMFESERGGYPEAERLLKRGLEVVKDRKEPLFLAHISAIGGNLYRSSGRLAEALPFYTKAVALRESNKSPPHELSQALRDLADCQRELGNLDAASAIYAKSIGLVENSPQHKYHLAFAISGLAENRLAQKDLTASEALARKALALFESMETPPKFTMAICQMTLARLKEQTGANDEALVLYKHAIEGFDSGPQPTTSLRALPAIDGAARLLGRGDEAQAFEKRAADIRKLRTVDPPKSEAPKSS